MEMYMKKICFIMAIALSVFVTAGCGKDKPKTATNVDVEIKSLSFDQLKVKANEGDVLAQYYLALEYLKDNNAFKDSVEAVKWLKKAAEKGHPGAQNVLGLAYERGWGGLKKDDKEALKLYQKAANQNHAGGQYSLGLFYYKGLGGLEKNEEEAYKLFKKAADKGHPLAKKKIEEKK